MLFIIIANQAALEKNLVTIKNVVFLSANCSFNNTFSL